MRNLILSLMGMILLFGCGEGQQEEAFVEESFIGGKNVYSANQVSMKNAMLLEGISVDREIFGYKAYTIPYTTTDIQGKEVNITGLLVIPTNLNDKLKDEGLSMVSYGHGTIFSAFDRPSYEAQYEPIGSAVAFSAAGGFATLITDYIGYENGNPSLKCDEIVNNRCVGDKYYFEDDIDIHPYLLKNTLAKNSIDFINTVKEVAQKNGIKLNNKLFISGYSEGGFTAMSTLKKLEENNIFVVGTAPMAGPHDLEAMAKIALDIHQTRYAGYSPALTLLTLNAYSEKYDYNLSQIIDIPKYSVQKLLYGFYDEDEINKAILENTTQLFLPTFLTEYQNNENHWLKVAFRENSGNNWKPKSPVKLIHCEGDDVVPFNIAQETFNNLSNNGTQDISLSIPDAKSNIKLTHSECFYPALESAVDWFIELRDK